MDYQPDPPLSFDVPYTELAAFVPLLDGDWGWQRMLTLMPQLLTDGHAGGYAVVQSDSQAVEVYRTRYDALMECQRRGGPSRARYYLIADRHPVGRTHARLRQCPDTSSNSPRVAS